MSDDDWDKLSRRDEDAPPEPVSEASAEVVGEEGIKLLVDAVAPELLSAIAEAEAAKAKVKRLTEDLARFAPELAGEVTIYGNEYTATVKRSERFEWDSDVLAALYADKEDLPAHIKMKLSVDKKRYDRMSDDDKAALASALTIKLSAPTIEVKPNV